MNMPEDIVNIIQIVKKQGSSQDYDESKVYYSMASASDEAGHPLPQAALTQMTAEVSARVRTGMTTAELRGIILERLRSRGYDAIADTYEEG